VVQDDVEDKAMNDKITDEEFPGINLLDEAKARGFDTIATQVFAPIYPVIADQAMERTKIRHGICVEIGSGPGHLSIALAARSDLRVFALDPSPVALMIALEHIRDAGLVRRVLPVLGDVHEMPFEDDTVDLIVSRGSWFFWDDLSQAFREIFRVLAPGGFAYIGGGFGNAYLKNEIDAEMKKRESDWEKGVSARQRKNRPERIRAEFEKAGIIGYRLIQDESGLWALMEKQ